ncbi:MAG TPA: hypothetical protein VK465_16150 [Fibrobacteria bacterium]|nr:hypothetical protein [Fibrobacteria bacterium]
MEIGEKAIRLVLLAVTIAFAGIGVLSVVLNYRDFAFYLATNVMSYKKQIFDLEEEANRRSRFYADQRGRFESLQRTNDSLRRKVESLERKIESHKLSFKREVNVAVYGYEKEITVHRD